MIRSTADVATEANRLRHAQLLLCDGGCCGNPTRGHCPIPLADLRARWKARGLTPAVSLAVTTCLGPCDVSNVACILHAQGTWWLGNLERHDYDLLAEWAEQCRDGLAPLPSALVSKTFKRWRRPD